MMTDLLFVGTVFAMLFSITLVVWHTAEYLGIRRGRSVEYALWTFTALSVYLILHAWLAAGHFYDSEESNPPHYIYVIIIGLSLIAGLSFVWRSILIEYVSPRWLTLVQVWRLPLAVVSWRLSAHDDAPTLLSFVGGNYDLVIGLSAPLVAYFLYPTPASAWAKKLGMAWQVLGIALCLNTLVLGCLSISSSWQLLAYDQPNMAAITFPYIWGFAFCSPIFLWAHLIMLFQKYKIKNQPAIIEEMDILPEEEA